MESTDKNKNDNIRSRPRLIRDEATLSAFRKRNKKLIVVLLLFFITTLSTIGSLTFYLLRNDVYYNKHDSSIRAFCHHTSDDANSCEIEYSRLITRKHEDIKNPDHVLNLSLRAASEELDTIATTWRIVDDDPDELRNCSIALRVVKGEISRGLEMLSRSRSTLMEEQWGEVWNRTTLAKDGLKSACLESSSAVSGQITIRAKVARVEMHLNYTEDYLTRYHEALRLFSDEVDDGKGVIFVQNFAMCMVGLQFLFMFFLILSLFRTW